MKFVAIIIFLTSVVAGALQITTTWVDKSEFDGTTWRYAYLARGNKDGLSEKVVTRCTSGLIKSTGQKILKSVEFALVIDGDFSDPQAASLHEGSVNVRAAIETCLNQVGADRSVNAPIALVFPPVSAPTDVSTSISASENH